MAAHRGPAANAEIDAEWSALGTLRPHPSRANLVDTRLDDWLVIEGPRRFVIWGTTEAGWLIECTVCGARRIVPSSTLLRRRTPHCRPRPAPQRIDPGIWPTLRQDMRANVRREDLVGQRHGTLTVVDGPRALPSPNGQGHAAWLCRCDCGRMRVSAGDRIARGRVRTCGSCAPPALPPPVRWGELLALACSIEGCSIERLARRADLFEHRGELERVLDGEPVRRDSALEGRLARIAVSYVAEQECVRLGMAAPMIERALGIAAAADERTIGDVARTALARLEERAA